MSVCVGVLQSVRGSVRSPQERRSGGAERALFGGERGRLPPPPRLWIRGYSPQREQRCFGFRSFPPSARAPQCSTGLPVRVHSMGVRTFVRMRRKCDV